MAGLQRSAISFRRQGSSGLVWDDKLIQEELNSDKPAASDQELSAGSAADQKVELRRSRSDGGGGGRRNYHRTIKVEQAEDPPSPRLAGCGFCSVFGRPAAVKTNTKKKPGKPKHR